MTIGDMLRKYRTQRQWSADELGKRVGYTGSYIRAIEGGKRPLTPEGARLCDDALDLSGLLQSLVKEAESVERRALLGVALSAGTLGIKPLARIVQSDIWRDRVGNIDLDELVDRYARRFVVDAGPEYMQELLTEIVVLQQRITEKTDPVDELRAAARLSELYGLCCGNALNFQAASDWYMTATMYATESRDQVLRDYISARTSNRLIFEGAPLGAVEQTIAVPLAGSLPTPGRAEALAARVCVSTIRGNATEAGHALNQMRDTIETLPDGHGVPHLEERYVFHRAFMASRLANLGEAHEHISTAQRVLSAAGLTYWQKENAIYWGLALVRTGGIHIRSGIEHTLTVLRDGTPAIGVIKAAARSVYDEVPSSMRWTEEMRELREHISIRPGPQHTLVTA